MLVEHYIGVTGFVDRDEVLAALRCMPQGVGRRLMVGVLASDKTLTGEPRGRPNRYPELADVGCVFVEDARCLNLVHYATRNRRDLVREARQIADHAGDRLDGFQINACWPPVVDLAALRADGHFVVLQIGAAALTDVETPEALRAAVAEYASRGAINAVLLDGSGGRGVALRAATLRPLLRALEGLGIGLGVAGGLPDAMADYLELRAQFRDLSCDAEGRLRDDDDRLDLGRMRAYLGALTGGSP